MDFANEIREYVRKVKAIEKLHGIKHKPFPIIFPKDTANLLLDGWQNELVPNYTDRGFVGYVIIVDGLPYPLDYEENVRRI